MEHYGDDIGAHPVGTGPFHLKQWRRSSLIVLERNPQFREMHYDADPASGDAQGHAILAQFKGRRIPMVDEVHVSCIEENQPRWLAFLNAQTRMKLSSSSWCDLHRVADLLKSADQAVGGLLSVGAVEVGGAEVVPFGAVAQHVPGGGEHGGGHGDDGLLSTASGAHAVELRLQVAALDLDGRPGGLHHGRLEPLAAAAQPSAAALAGALVVARTHAGPRQQVAGRGEARHVDADLRHDHMRADIAQAGRRAQPLGGLSKRFEPEAHLLLDGSDGLIQRVDMPRCSLSMKR